jgi:hypothetical protein
VTQPAVHSQILSSAIGFVEVGVVDCENVPVFQVSEAAIIASV